jgi:hypothetical protein
MDFINEVSGFTERHYDEQTLSLDELIVKYRSKKEE